MANQLNVLGTRLQLCCGNGGYTREGFCYVPDQTLAIIVYAPL
ncbi:hypothetical protein PSEHALCIP103_00489 [Pseudoalteromonas haloplanktis]|uniref:Uncharacterized protein n=1 Tax=Pseudoalteromonas haloplanktis TaxID=228 RepID=A0A9W4QSZ1_PSEHA|nr:hypothetical protein PSEHALCIP103_00489 [Pseudoalteromonas haloplanktis]